jgi:HD superfamily phosphohydrolase
MLGTSYLTQKFMKNLAGFNKSKYDIKLVSIAALLHDIGHAPFSHAFEICVWNRLYPNDEWNHEIQCKKIIEWMKENDYLQDINPYHIQAIINGDDFCDKPYLSQIVANKIHGIDTDKLDYLQRDAQYITGDTVKNSFNVILNKGRIIDGNLCYSYDSRYCIKDFFETRLNLWNKVYTQSKVKAAEYMMADAILLANSIFPVLNKITDINEFLTYDDSIINVIINSKDKTLAKSQNIIKRAMNGDYYISVFCKKCNKPTIIELLKFSVKGKTITEDDFIIHSFKLNYGKSTNPIYDVPFFIQENKRKFSIIYQDESIFHPVNVEEYYTEIFCKNKSLHNDIKAMCNKWYESSKFK